MVAVAVRVPRSYVCDVTPRRLLALRVSLDSALPCPGVRVGAGCLLSPQLWEAVLQGGGFQVVP